MVASLFPKRISQGITVLWFLVTVCGGRRFGSDPNIIGQTISLDNEPYTVIGVAAPDFQFPPKASLPTAYQFPPEVNFYIPMALTPEEWSNRGPGFLPAIARLKSKTRIEQAQADVVGIAERLARQYPDSNRNESVRLVLIHQQVVGKTQTALLALWARSGCATDCVRECRQPAAGARGARQKEMRSERRWAQAVGA